MPTALELYRPTGSGQLPVLLRQPYVPWDKRLPASSRRVEKVKQSRFTVAVPERWNTQLRSVTYTTPVWLANPPELVRDLPEPLHYIKTGLRKLDDGRKDGQDRTLTLVVAGGVLVAMIWYPWLPDLLVGGLWLGSLAYGASVAWLCHSGTRPWRWTLRRVGFALALLWVLGFFWLAHGVLVELAVLSLAMAQAFAYRPDTTSDDPGWASEDMLVRNWTDAGIFGQRVPEELWFRRIVPFHEDEHGIQALTVVPMAGPRRKGRVLNVGTEQVEKARAGLERVMGLKVGQLHVSHDPEHDAGAITLTVTPPVVKHTIVKGVVPERWDYNEPLWIGNDHLGRPVYRRTWGCHSGFVAMTQKGKTAATLWDVVHAALDPNVPIYLLDFKGDDKDFKALLPLCKRSVTGASLASARKALAILQELEQLSESRTSLTPEDHGVVVVIDEWFRLLSLAQRLEPKLAAELDSLLTELMATAASRRVKFISLFQGGTADYINKPMRINIGQRFCGVTESTDEIRYFLENMPPKNQLPQAPGQFVFKDDGVGPVLVTHPYLDPAGFAEGCARALRIRGLAAAEPTVDPVHAILYSLLAVEPQKATELLRRMPSELRPPGKDEKAQAQALGYVLRKMEGVRNVTVGGTRSWGLAPGYVPSQGGSNQVPLALSCTGDLESAKVTVSP